ncbi:MAG: DUF475 domain-containing protein [Patescibacteria group bacterium]|nr:DUF475 domain-containing protein [Patescibacteria group bacterium]
MDPITLILTISGLALFEIISSIDNAIVNAEVLHTMSEKSKKWFLFWGLLFAVFIIRGLLPWVIVYASNPALGIVGSFTAAWSGDPAIKQALDASSPILLLGGGTFLILLFLHWLFIEDKRFGLPHERFFAELSPWFYAVASLFLLCVVWLGIHVNVYAAFGAVVGSTAFFITHGFKETAEKAEEELASGESRRSDISKILYLEAIDSTFSIDGVLGAFAFTLSVPLIIIGNGIGACIVRQLTVGNIERIKRLVYLKNGAMYSILFLGMIMALDAFGVAVPGWVSPAITFLIVGFFFQKSRSDGI